MKTRKIVALLLAVVMVFAMSASAFAIDTGDTYSSYTFNDLKLKVQVSMATEGLTISGGGPFGNNCRRHGPRHPAGVLADPQRLERQEL